MDIYRPSVGQMIKRDFFYRSPLECSRDLIGATLQWGDLSASIVETEAYDSKDDPACHTYFRSSARAFVTTRAAGTAYVYLNYGVHWMLNVLVKGRRSGFVLIRALHPKKGIEAMQVNRGCLSLTELCSGPGKLTQAFGIQGVDHGRDLCSDPMYAFHAGSPQQAVRQCSRVGISVAMDYPWRFVVADSPYLSVPPRPTTRRRKSASLSKNRGKPDVSQRETPGLRHLSA